MLALLHLVSAKLSEVMLFESVQSLTTFVPIDIPERYYHRMSISKESIISISSWTCLWLNLGIGLDRLGRQGDNSGIVALKCQVATC